LKPLLVWVEISTIEVNAPTYVGRNIYLWG
jgi:hypothetical protein